MSENNFSNDYTNFKLIHTSRYGNSRVFTATNNGKKVIVKTLKPEYVDDPACRESLRQEYETTSILDNKFIRKALDFVRIEGYGDCIIYEYVDGKSLAEHVRVGTLSEKQMKSVLTDVCDALYYLHRSGIVHCNLNPDNIIVTAADGHPKLIDIGIPETKQDADRELLIKEMEFIAPEIIKGEDYDSRADIYSLGKIMEFIGERNISKQFGPVATHCTQFSKEQRFDSITEVRSAITKGPSFVKLIIAGAVLLVLVVVAIIYVPKIQDNVEQERTERMAVDFDRELEKMQNELPELCKKYELKSLNESLAFNWYDDSLKTVEVLVPYLALDEYRDKAMKAIAARREGIAKSRQADFDRLLIEEFKTTNDSTAVKMRSALNEPTDEMLLGEARKWHSQRK